MLPVVKGPPEEAETPGGPGGPRSLNKFFGSDPKDYPYTTT